MKTKVTATLMAKMKRQAKQRAKDDETAYSVHLEAVARENGFSSWFDVLHQDQSPIEGDPLTDLEIDPILGSHFDITSNEDRTEEELQRWWMRPFAVSQPGGVLHVRCLDGGAHDRSTSYGVASNIEEAKSLAVNKLRQWMGFMDTPIVLLDGDGSVSMVVDTLWPDVDKTVLDVLPSIHEVAGWKARWEAQKASHPERIAAQLRAARSQKLDSWGLGHRTKIKRWPF